MIIFKTLLLEELQGQKRSFLTDIIQDHSCPENTYELKSKENMGNSGSEKFEQELKISQLRI